MIQKSKTICDILKNINIKSKTKVEVEAQSKTKVEAKTKAETKAEAEAKTKAEIEAERNNLNDINLYNDTNKTQKLNVAAYIYTIKNGIVYIGCVRKGYDGCRSYSSRDGKYGAAGTLEKYWGKWTNIGGSKSKGGNRTDPISNYNAIIEEINDECGIKECYKINKTNNNVNIDLTYLKIKVKDPLHLKLTLNHCEKDGLTTIFIFKMENRLFETVFPEKGYTSHNLFKRSEGEIDAIKSFTFEEIFNKQRQSIMNSNNNYFISYFITNLKNIFIPYLYKYIIRYKYIDIQYIQYIHDLKKENIKKNTSKRMPPKEEFEHNPYPRF